MKSTTIPRTLLALATSAALLAGTAASGATFTSDPAGIEEEPTLSLSEDDLKDVFLTPMVLTDHLVDQAIEEDRLDGIRIAYRPAVPVVEAMVADLMKELGQQGEELRDSLLPVTSSIAQELILELASIPAPGTYLSDSTLEMLRDPVVNDLVVAILVRNLPR